ncbi:MAG: serine/threonine protein kinase [Phycisphaerales bacterium]|nr:serine/threonine protein kinase [Phycisphaerales bacterium]
MPTDREKDIFFGALDLEPGERAAYLAERCAGDDAMAVRLRELLAAHDKAEEFMAAPTVDAPAGGTAASGAFAEDDSELNTRIGPYTLESVLGEGGFGRVYLARQREPVARVVALKLLRAGMDSHAIVTRFETERQALAVMEHPGVAKVLDAGQTKGGRPYFAMEYVRGEPITAFCTRKALGVRERIDLFEQVCLAVQHAHHKGLIHRDLKPSNVLVTLVDDHAIAKVIDFGIAKAIGAQSAGATAMTLAGHLIGTPAYMSPEQLTSPADVDTRSDVYTLGVLLYEMLTGTLPFEAERLERTPLASLARIICDETPPKPSTRVLRTSETDSPGRTQHTRHLAGRLRGDLDWIVMRAMEKEPGRRYQTPAALAADLRRYLRNEPVEAGPPSGGYRLRKFARRHRVPLAATGLVGAAIVAGLITSLAFAARADAERHRTAVELEKSRSFAAFTTDMLRGLDPAVASGEDTKLLRSMLVDARDRLARSRPESPEVEAEIRELIGTAFEKIGAMTEAEEQFASSAELSARTLGDEDPKTLQARHDLALVHMEMTRLEEARHELDSLLGAWARVRGPESPEAIEILFMLAEIDRLSGDSEQARDRLRRVVDLRRAVLGDRHKDTMSARNSLATVLDDLGDHDAAIQMFGEIIPFQVETLGPDHPNTLATENNLANSLANVGRNAEAAEMLERVLASKRRVYPPDHPSLIVALNNLSISYRAIGRPEDAEALLDEAVAIARKTLGERDMRTLILSGNLAGLMVKTGRAEQARPMLEASLPICEEVLGREHPLTLAVMSHLVRADLALGDAAGACLRAEDLVARADRSLPAQHADRVKHRRLWGEALLKSGQAEHAEAVLREAFEMEGDDSSSKGDTAALLAQACDALGKPDEAARWRQAAPPAAPAPDGG